MNLIKAVYFESGEIPMGVPDYLFMVRENSSVKHL